MTGNCHGRARHVAGAEAEDIIGVTLHYHDRQVQSWHFEPAEKIACL